MHGIDGCRVSTMTAQASTSTATYFAPARLHPYWTQAALQGRRSLDGLRTAACAALVVMTLLASVALARDAGTARWLLEHRHAAAIAIALVLVFSLRLAIAELARSLRYGWTAALPLPPQTGRRTLLLATMAFGALATAWLAVGLAGLGVSLDMSAYVAMLGSAITGVVAACVALAWMAARAWRRPPVVDARPGMRVPLLSLSWLEHPRSPYLVAWQNRECARQWRTSGGAKPVCLVLLLFPGSPSPALLFVWVAMVLLVAWYRCVLQSSLGVVERAMPLTRAWPLAHGQVAHALMRFPLAASVLVIGMLFAALLTMLPPLPAAGGSVLGLALAAPLTLARLVVKFREHRQ